MLSDAAKFTKDLSVAGNYSLKEQGQYVTVSFDGGKVVFDKKTGEMISYEKNNCEFINMSPAGDKKGFIPNLVRASLDNDSYGQKEPWAKINLHDAETVVTDFRVVDKLLCIHGFWIIWNHVFYFLSISWHRPGPPPLCNR